MRAWTGWQVALGLIMALGPPFDKLGRPLRWDSPTRDVVRSGPPFGRTSSGQAWDVFRGRLRGDAGMWFDSAQFPANRTRAVNGSRCAGIVGCAGMTGAGRGLGSEPAGGGGSAAWDVFSRSGGCVQFWGRCVQFSGECVQFLAECVQFRGGCVHFGGRCVQFSAVRPGWGWGADGRRDSSAPLRCARNDRQRRGRCARDACVDGVTGCAGIDHGAGSRLKTPG